MTHTTKNRQIMMYESADIDGKNYIRKPETSTMKSMTRPNESYTMSELITRSAQGLPLTVKTFVPMYYGEEMPNLKTLDLSEAAAIIRENRKKIEEVTAAVNQRKLDAQNRRLTQQLRTQWETEQSEKAQLEQLEKKYRRGEADNTKS